MSRTHQLEAPAMSYANWLAYCSAVCVSRSQTPRTDAAMTVEVLIAEHAVRAGIVLG